MQTIVEYTDSKEAKNQYPERIISPSRSASCCFSDIEEIGTPIADTQFVFQYKRCRECGFTVRVILAELPDAALVEELRRALARCFVRVGSRSS
jgi:hypothetical protein